MVNGLIKLANVRNISFLRQCYGLVLAAFLVSPAIIHTISAVCFWAFRVYLQLREPKESLS